MAADDTAAVGLDDRVVPYADIAKALVQVEFNRTQTEEHEVED